MEFTSTEFAPHVVPCVDTFPPHAAGLKTSTTWFVDSQTTADTCLIPIIKPTLCAICIDETDTSPSVALSACGHIFHHACIATALQTSSKCPVCKTTQPIRVRGPQPVGTMAVLFNAGLDLPEETPGSGTYIIHYNIPSGIQATGIPYRGTLRTAYLPGHPRGQLAMQQLMRAWDRGLVFAVGTSLTTGIQNTVIWNTIHHKTHTGLDGWTTPHSYPDPAYVDRLLAEIEDQL